MGARLVLAIAAAAALAGAAAAFADPIPEGPGSREGLQEFIGAPWSPRPVSAPTPPRHPFMAPNERSNIHVDAFQTDVNQLVGPLGRDMETVSTFYRAVCGSVTFDAKGRLVSICVGLINRTLVMLDPRTLEELARFDLPPRQPEPPGGVSIFQDFAGGGYFYLDDKDRAVIPTTTRHILVVKANDPPGFTLERDYDVSGTLASGDKIISALPDWSGRLWYASIRGVMGTVDPATGATRTLDLGEEIQNSFAVGDEGDVYVVTKKALYRLEAGADGAPKVVWREVYPNSGISKPGQVHAGSGTTPTLQGRTYVSITDNSDPMNVIVYRRARSVEGPREVCRVPVFQPGASATDNSLIGAGRAIIVENNYGYTGPTATEEGRRTAPGVERIDIDRDGSGCTKVWANTTEVSPTVVPKLSLGNGLVYIYTKEPGDNDPWYLTALDFRTGRVAFKRLAGAGLGYNNNYAPVTIGPDGTAYVGVLGGLVALRDRQPPAQRGAPGRPRLALMMRFKRGRAGCVQRAARASIRGADTRLVRRVVFKVNGRKALRDARPPFVRKLSRKRLKRAGKRAVVSAAVTLKDGRRATLRESLRPCR